MARKNGNGKAALAAAEAALAESVGMGFEEVGKDNLQIPFIGMVQTGNPQLKKNAPEYIAEASPGDIFNSITNQVWDGDEGVVVLPVYFQMKYLEFIPWGQGGGFVGELSSNSTEVKNVIWDKENTLELLESGNELVRTAQHWVQIVHEDGALESAILPMKKTQLSKSRKWNSLMMTQKHNGKKIPPWCNTYVLRTAEDSNDKGGWYSWVITHKERIPIEDYLTSPLTVSGQELYNTIIAGGSQIVAPAPEAITDQALTLDDDVPF
jgi:hypothetical protein